MVRLTKIYPWMWGLILLLLLIIIIYNDRVSRLVVELLGGDGHDHHIMIVGTNLWPGYEPLYLAQAWGTLNKKQIRLVEFSSASQVVRAYQNGVIQAAALTLDEAILLRSKGLALKIILVMDISNGGDALLVKPGITGPAQLRGLRIGVEESALGAYVFSRFLEVHSILESEVTLVSLDIDQHKKAFLEGKLDGVITFEPVRSHLLAAGAKELFSSKDIPGEIMDVLVVDPEYLQAHMESFTHLVRVWSQTLEQMKIRKEDAGKILAARMNLPLDEVWLSYEGLIFPNIEQNLSYLTGESPLIQGNIDALLEIMLQKGLIASPLSWDHTTSTQPLQSVRESP